MVKFKGVKIADEEIVHYKDEGGGVGVVIGGRAKRWRSRRNRVGKEEQQGGVEIRAPIGEDQAQFLDHHRKGRVCRGSDGREVGDGVW